MLPGALSLPAGVTAGLLWTGSWELTGNFVNRGDLRVNAFGSNSVMFTARAQVLDRRPSFFWEEPEAGLSSFGGALYHNPTGSRFLYGIIDEWGLQARVRNPWGKSVAFAETRKPMTADLKTEPSTTREPESYLYLGSGRIGPLRAFASAQVDKQLAPAAGGGLDLQFAKKTSLRAEGFYTEKTLPASAPSAWFAFPPPLPERDFRLSAASLFFTSPFFGAAADGAYSETFAWGRDVYGNLALRLGDKPWQMSLGADAAGSRFVDRDGSAVGAGFRTAARFDWKGKKSSLFRAGLSLRASEIGEPFSRSSSTLSYRFPTSLLLPLLIPVKPGTLSLSATRDARDTAEILDSLGADHSFNVGPVRTALHTALTGIADPVTAADKAVDNTADKASDDALRGEDAPSPFPGAASYEFNSIKTSVELSYYTGPFQFKTKVGYTGTHSKPPVWDASCSASVRGKPGRFTVKVASPSFPDKWDCTLSWRLDLKTEKRKKP
jgi:hypothetical protein